MPASTCRCWWAARRCRKNSRRTQDRARRTATPSFYAKDAMTGLRLMNELMDPATRDAVLGAHIVHGSAGAVPKRRRSRSRRRARGAAARCAPIFRFPPRRISTARVRDVPQPGRKSGATSIRTCSTAGIWGSRAISKRLLAEREPKALELFHDVEEVKAGSRAVHEGKRGVAVLRSRARRQRDSSVRARRGESASTRSTSAGSRAPTDCA